MFPPRPHIIIPRIQPPYYNKRSRTRFRTAYAALTLLTLPHLTLDY